MPKEIQAYEVLSPNPNTAVAHLLEEWPTESRVSSPEGWIELHPADD